MAIGRGIHVFYISPRHSTDPGDRTSGVNLYWLHMSGTKVLSSRQINLGVDVRYGVSAIMDRGWLNIFVTHEDGSLWKISTQDGVVFHREAIPSVMTKTSTSVVHVAGKMQVFTNSYSQFYRLPCLQSNTFDGVWTGNRPVLDNSSRPILLSGGPCAIMRGDDLILLYGSALTERNPLQALLIDARGAISEFSPGGGVLTPNAPGASLLSAEGDLMVVHHGWPLKGSKSDNNLYAATVDRNNRWQKEEIPPYAELNENPAACTFGGRVYAFFQGTDSRLWLQVFMGGRWLSETIPVVKEGAQVSEVWYGPAALAI